MAAIAAATGVTFDTETEVVVVGAGAAGLIAALSARALGAEVLVAERDAVPRGSTALSAGLIPAAGTVFQARQGLADDLELFRADLEAKTHGTADPTVARVATAAVGPALAWLHARYGLPFDVIADFRYPGHSAFRMHGLPRRTGAELIDALRTAVESEEITLLTSARVTTLYTADGGRVAGVGLVRADGRHERIACRAVILACNGYGGNRALLQAHLPAMLEALWFGHSGNDGDAVAWGQALGAELRHMSGHQGHGSVATPHGILISWATMTEGGFQVNTLGRRFSDESRGYSEQGEIVVGQPDGIAWSIFDDRIAAIAGQFEDFRNAEAQGAIRRAATIPGLADATGLPADTLAATWAAFEACKTSGAADAFGRPLAGVRPLAPPYCAVKVTGGLFHTQGGLAIDDEARVLMRVLRGGVLGGGRPLPNLFAAGGAAVGCSGAEASGYLSGNGLLTAVGLGFVAGRSAAELVRTAA